jgi:phosphoglycerol transferase MdoB-like AlkP superfamily enzyme
MARVVFLVFHFPLTQQLSIAEIATILLLGLRMDAAMAGYWTLIPGLLFAISFFTHERAFRVSLSIVMLSLLFVSCVIVVADLELYRHWSFRMDATPLMYLGDEGAGSVGLYQLLLLGGIFIIMYAFFIRIYQKKIHPSLQTLKEANKTGALLLAALTALLFVPIRSSFSVAPLNTGVVFFHKTNAYANHAGINVVWNFFKGISYYKKQKYPEHVFDSADALELTKEITTTEGNTPLLNQSRPNVLMIILESFTSKIIEPLGGHEGVTPNINALVHEGILFDQIYASGDRTDKGLVSILSGYPAQPRTSIIKLPKKTQSLPFLPRQFNDMGYHTSFVYGGDIGFANMESYITMAGFSQITEDDDFDNKLNYSKWGVHDHIVFNRLLTELDTASRPFFKVMLSLSSHEPFDVPIKSAWQKGNDEVALFMNACHYTDSAFGAFIREAKKRPWWNNTLVVVTADHGHRFPEPEELKDKSRFSVPLLWLGGALAKRDTVIHTLGSQTDLAPTLLAQWEQQSHSYPFSKNLLARKLKPFAVYAFANGFGYVYDQGEFIYDFDLKGYYRENGPMVERERGEAFIQALFLDYNRR